MAKTHSFAVTGPIREIDAFPRRLCQAERHHETNRDDSVDSVLPPPLEALRPFLKPNTCLLSFRRKSRKSDPCPLHVSETERMIRKSWIERAVKIPFAVLRWRANGLI